MTYIPIRYIAQVTLTVRVWYTWVVSYTGYGQFVSGTWQASIATSTSRQGSATDSRTLVRLLLKQRRIGSRCRRYFFFRWTETKKPGTIIKESQRKVWNGASFIDLQPKVVLPFLMWRLYATCQQILIVFRPNKTRITIFLEQQRVHMFGSRVKCEPGRLL